MDRSKKIQNALTQLHQAEKRVVNQAESLYILRSANLDAGQAELKLEELCSALALSRARFSHAITAVEPPRTPQDFLRNGEDVGGPRWRIGWGGLA